MAWLPRIDELREAANSPEWKDMFILYYRRSMNEDYMMAMEINKVCGEVDNVVQDRFHYLKELDTLAGQPMLKKMGEFFKEIQRKDKERVFQLQMLGRETELGAREKDLFIQKLKVLVHPLVAVGFPVTYWIRYQELSLARQLDLFLMGLDDVYQPIKGSIMTREILPEAKDAFLIISREESHRGIPPSSVKAEKPQVSAFVARQTNNNNNRNKNWSNNGNNVNRGNYDSLLCKNCGLKGHTIDRYFELIGYPPGFKRNPNLKPANSFNNSKSNNVDVRKGSGGTNESKTPGSSIGTMSLTNEQVMKLMSLLNEKYCSTAQANMAGYLPLPNDEEEGTSGRDGSMHQPDVKSEGSRDNPVQKLITSQAGHDGEHNTTLVEENTLSEGNIVPSLEVPVFQNVP
ncbi:hypothetical protein Tco_1141590, partial [Tanacetum coccineum]